MECQSCDSKQLFKVFDASRRKRTRKKGDAVDDSNSLITDDSASGCPTSTVRRASSAKGSLENLPHSQNVEVQMSAKREGESNHSLSRLHNSGHRAPRSPNRHRRSKRESLSLALKAGMASTPHSESPIRADDKLESIPRDQDSYIYEFLEETIKKEKRKHHNSRRYEEGNVGHDTPNRERRHRQRREPHSSCERVHSRETPCIDPNVLYETFAKLCAQLTDKNLNSNKIVKSQSHKSLQCEVISKRDLYDSNQRPVKLESSENFRETNVTKNRSVENLSNKFCDEYIIKERGNDRCINVDKHTSDYLYDGDLCCNYSVHHSKVYTDQNKSHQYRSYPAEEMTTKQGRSTSRNNDPYRENVNHNCSCNYDYKERRSNIDQQMLYRQRASRSFDIHDQTCYNDYDVDEHRCSERIGRNDAHRERERERKRCSGIREKRYCATREDLFDEREKYEPKIADDNRGYDDLTHKRHTPKRKSEAHFNRSSTISIHRDRHSERVKESAVSIEDGDISVVSARSHYLRAVKQEISEQREAMDKMMQLWKELMRCFKGISQNQEVNDKSTHEAAATHARDSAAAHLRLWQECMRRYETVARDVGDTDARLMEEINKQRSEMSEMAGMWQECLQKYREMSSDFNNLKQKLVVPEASTRLVASPLTCAEGESQPIMQAPYQLPHSMGPQPSMMYQNPSPPIRPRSAMPPGWWWCEDRAPAAPRRRQSPDSRDSCDRNNHRRHKERDKDDGRYKEKSSTKPKPTHSEHRHRKR